MRQSLSVMTLSVISTAVVAANRFISPAGAYPAAGANAYGASEAPALTSGDRLPVTAIGSVVVETGGAIAAGSLVETDNTGRALLKNTGIALGRLAPGEVSTAAGQFVEVILIPN